jgi:hypothetical protein
MHEGAVLQRGAGNALTMSGPQVYHNRQITFISHHQTTIRGFSLGQILTNVETAEQVR